MKIKKRFLMCLLAVLMLLTAGCGKEEEAAFDGHSIPESAKMREKVEELTLTVTEADFALLEECVNLKKLDLSGSTCYDAILSYMEAHPQVEVIYTVALGDQVYAPTIDRLVLEDGSFDFSGLMTALKYLPEVKSLELPRTSLINEDLNYIRQTYPQVELRYTIELLGEEYDSDITSLDLTAMTDSDLERVISRLTMFPELTEVKLSDEEGNSSLSVAAAGYLMNAQPGLQYQYYLNLFGQIIPHDAQRVEFTKVQIGNEGETQIREALRLLKNCTYFKLEDCGIDNEVLASIREDNPQTDVVWRIRFGPYSYLTDTEVIRAVYNVEDKHVPLLRYFKDVKYIDMGHNSTLTDLSFVAQMPDLEIMIGSGSAVKNLEGFENCKKLNFLELGYCYALTDVTPLAELSNLEYLNISFTGVKDISCLYDLPLKRFVCLDPIPNWESQEAFKAEHPDCWIRFTGENPYSLGWRYDDIGETRSEIYKKVREVFNLDEVDKAIARQEAKKNEEAGGDD